MKVFAQRPSNGWRVQVKRKTLIFSATIRLTVQFKFVNFRLVGALFVFVRLSV
jgi:hypothetical protein